MGMIYDVYCRFNFTSPLYEKFYFVLPSAYFTYGWAKRLKPAEKTCLMIALYEKSTLSETIKGDKYAEKYKKKYAEGFWSFGVKVLAKHFHVNKSTITRGMNGLQEKGIIEIHYGKRKGKILSPSWYRFLELYNPEEREKECQKNAHLCTRIWSFQPPTNCS